jgi:hypothetical protein
VQAPPEIDITTPSSIACPGTLSLTATTSDPDQDLSHVRWTVDGVLLAPGTTSIPMSAAHQLKAVAFDARGAATTDWASVVCQ